MLTNCLLICQAVFDQLQFDLPKAVFEFGGVSERCLEVVESIGSVKSLGRSEEVELDRFTVIVRLSFSFGIARSTCFTSSCTRRWALASRRDAQKTGMSGPARPETVWVLAGPSSDNSKTRSGSDTSGLVPILVNSLPVWAVPSPKKDANHSARLV